MNETGPVAKAPREAQCKQARPHEELVAEILDPRRLKTEREHAAAKEIDKLRQLLRAEGAHLENVKAAWQAKVDALGLAIVNANYPWTPEMRAAYEMLPDAKVGADGTATVTRKMIGAAHDVMLAKGDFVLSAVLLERIYLAMEQAAPPPKTPFDNGRILVTPNAKNQGAGGDMKKKQGLLYLLERSAELLERSAEEIWISHTIAGRWPKDDKHGARRDYKELCAMAKGLRKAHKYHKPNPLGGPSKMFDAIADRMRAEDSVKECMADYGLKFKRSNVELTGAARHGQQTKLQETEK